MTATPKPVAGLHHITAISGPPQPNVSFYTGPLGQRLVKRTVNFDDPGTYHLYYGDQAGTPGTILTFFPFVGARPGTAGTGAASGFSYAVAPAALPALREQLRAAGLDVTEAERFGAPVLSLRDPDGLVVELAATPEAPATGIGGFDSVTLWLTDPEPTARVLTDLLGYVQTAQSRDGGAERLRFTAPGSTARHVDLLRQDGAPRNRPGTGTIHHVAFRAETPEHQAALRESVATAGHSVTPRIDRQYFDAIYFREPGGILFEIATDPPGFAIDEPAETMGQALMLPPQYEPHRARIEAQLPPLTVPA